MRRSTPNHRRDRAVLLTVLTLVLFAEPTVSWSLGATPAWYLPYLLWFGLILLAAWLNRGQRDNDDDR